MYLWLFQGSAFIVVYSNSQCSSASCLSSLLCSFYLGKPGDHLLGKSCPLGLSLVRFWFNIVINVCVSSPFWVCGRMWIRLYRFVRGDHCPVIFFKFVLHFLRQFCISTGRRSVDSYDAIASNNNSTNDVLGLSDDDVIYRSTGDIVKRSTDDVMFRSSRNVKVCKSCCSTDLCNNAGCGSTGRSRSLDIFGIVQ